MQVTKQPLAINPHLPPETVDIDTSSALSGSKMDGRISTIEFHAHAALMAADTPPPEKAIPSDMFMCVRYDM